MFIADGHMWDSSASGNFVQTHVLKLEKGATDLRLLWKDRIAGSNDTNATDIQTVYLSENAGDPYLDLFEPTEDELKVKIL